jgi:hypothetical protein
MADTSKTIFLEPDSELARAIHAAVDLDIDVFVETDGMRYRLNRIDVETDPEDEWHRPEGFDPKRVLNLIGIGASADETNVAEFKDQYIADSIDHRG